jgi:hypothetical protein
MAQQGRRDMLYSRPEISSNMHNLDMQHMDQIPKDSIGHQQMVKSTEPRVYPISYTPPAAPDGVPVVIGDNPHSQNPGLSRLYHQFTYDDPFANYIGIDVFGRTFGGWYNDLCIDVATGKFVPLRVQCTDDVFNGQGGATWKRQRVKSIAPLTLRLAQWPFADLADKKAVLDLFQKSPMEGIKFFAKSLVLIPPMVLLGTIFRPSSGQIRNFGCYDPVPYRYYGRAKKSRNVKDDGLSERNTSGRSLLRKPVERILLPRRLCFVDDQPVPYYDEEEGQDALDFPSIDVRQWMKETKKNCPEYLLVAFSSMHFRGSKGHFRLHSLAREATQKAGLQWYWVSDSCISEKDNERSLDIWRISDVIRGCHELVVALETPRPHEKVEDLLGFWASSIWTLPELLLSPGRRFRTYHYELERTPNSMVWRLREHVMSKNQFAARCLKTDEDRHSVRRLLDHYLGNLRLSDLELTTVALQCFSSRSAGTDVAMFLNGDYSYALMGLLGRRPNINPSDTAFLAFARLSLENYNDRLFERFICLMPAEHDQHWYNTQDAYGAQLWDIEPTIQVAGIGEYKENQEDLSVDAVFEKEYFRGSMSDSTDDGQIIEMKSDFSQHVDSSDSEAEHADNVSEDASENNLQLPEPSHSKLHEEDVVILDGCFAATVHWDQFQQVWHARRLTSKRRVLQWVLRLALVPFIVGVVLVSLAPPLMPMSSTSQSGLVYRFYSSYQPAAIDASAMMACGAIFLIYSIGVWLAAPIIIRSIHGGKLWDTQAWFFGFEGHLPINQIEAKIFGVCKGRLTWSPYASSPLSYHNLQSSRWVVPQDPCDNPVTRELVTKARNARPGDMRIFTLVDTHSMTVTLFEARRPPEVLLVCGSEGGMQRALGCSFEWTTSTFYKETVLRLETRVLGRMERIRRVRLGIQRMEKATKRKVS